MVSIQPSGSKQCFSIKLHVLTENSLVLMHKSTNKLIAIPPQQKKCLLMLSLGLSSKEIGIRLNLSYRTVEHYLAHLRKVLDCRSSKELIIAYYDQLNYYKSN
jgi:shikimate kinase